MHGRYAGRRIRLSHGQLLQLDQSDDIMSTVAFSLLG